MSQPFVNRFTTGLYHWWQPLIRLHTILQIILKQNRVAAGLRLPRSSHGFFLLSATFETHLL